MEGLDLSLLALYPPSPAIAGKFWEQASQCYDTVKELSGFIMSPTIFREDGYRFFFFSREETRMHVHVYCGHGEAKFLLEPEIELAHNYRLSRQQIKIIEAIIEERQNAIRNAWRQYFTS